MALIQQDWYLFVQIAERIGANKSTKDGLFYDSVWIGDIHVSWSSDECRAFVTYTDTTAANRTRWLDNDIMVWFDTLRGMRTEC